MKATPSKGLRRTVSFGLRLFAQEQPFDLVLSGINGGEKLGGRARSSGTIGAAFTALAAGIPSLAISADQAITNYTAIAKFTAQLIRKIRSQGLPKNVLLSVNIPAGAIEGIAAVPMAMGEPRRLPRVSPTVSETGELTDTLPGRRARRAANARTNRKPDDTRARRRERRAEPLRRGNTDDYY